MRLPASSPHALACGGTSLQADGETGQVVSEKVWKNGTGRGATGGGVSSSFPLPSWLRDVGAPSPTSGQIGRGVPDMSAVADPRTGDRARVDGSSTVIGGTSAVSPLWAALAARLAQALGKPLGLLQATIYTGLVAGSVPPGFRDITDGDNRGGSSRPGWDACTGLGVPDGVALLTALRGGAGAGGRGAGGPDASGAGAGAGAGGAGSEARQDNEPGHRGPYDGHSAH